MASKMPPATEKQPPVGELPGGVPYESIITAVGTLAEQTPGGGGWVSASGEVSVIQGRVAENPDAGFFAFLSVDTLNVPLVSTSESSRVSPGIYRVRIPGKEFLLTLDPRTEPAIVEGMENVLRWFTAFEGSALPAGTGAAPAGEQATGIRGLIEKAGVAGAALVTRAGEKLNASVQHKTEATLAAQGDQQAKKVKLGGAVTATTLSGARKVRQPSLAYTILPSWEVCHGAWTRAYVEPPPPGCCSSEARGVACTVPSPEQPLKTTAIFLCRGFRDTEGSRTPIEICT